MRRGHDLGFAPFFGFVISLLVSVLVVIWPCKVLHHFDLTEI